MNYTIKRLTQDKAAPASYHLFSESGSLLQVADTGIGAETQLPQVRFARPDGTLLATMNIPPAGKAVPNPDYAIIQDFAVYAIISRRRRAAPAGEAGEFFYTLEAEGGSWLVLPQDEPAGSHGLYGQIPDGLHTLSKISDSELPPLIGRIYRAGEEFDFLVELTARRWRQTSLIVLALVYLLDNTDAV